MSDFCKGCSLRMFGEDFGDLVGLAEGEATASAICEGCGLIVVNRHGEKLEGQMKTKEQMAEEFAEQYSDYQFYEVALDAYLAGYAAARQWTKVTEFRNSWPKAGQKIQAVWFNEKGEKFRGGGQVRLHSYSENFDVYLDAGSALVPMRDLIAWQILPDYEDDQQT